MTSYPERTAVITGASRGLGAGLAEHFLARGMSIAVCARTRPAIELSDRVVTGTVDVTDAGDVDDFCREAVKQFGRIDLWINNAGVLEPIDPLREVQSDDFRRHLDINVLGVFHGTRSFVRHLRQRGGEGVLINISSGAARNAYAGWSAYCAGKAAVDRMTECVQLEEGDHGLRAYSVAPGIIDTAMQELIRSQSPEQFPMVDKFLELKRVDGFSSPEFVAARLLELAFDPAHRPAEVCTSLPLEKG